MPRNPDEELTMISIRLPKRDLDTLREHYPHGYQTEIKELVRTYCKLLRNPDDGAR